MKKIKIRSYVMDKLNLFQKRKMAIEELIGYECELRKLKYNNGDKLKGII